MSPRAAKATSSRRESESGSTSVQRDCGALGGVTGTPGALGAETCERCRRRLRSRASAPSTVTALPRVNPDACSPLGWDWLVFSPESCGWSRWADRSGLSAASPSAAAPTRSTPSLDREGPETRRSARSVVRSTRSLEAGRRSGPNTFWPWSVASFMMGPRAGRKRRAVVARAAEQAAPVSCRSLGTVYPNIGETDADFRQTFGKTFGLCLACRVLIGNRFP